MGDFDFMAMYEIAPDARMQMGPCQQRISHHRNRDARIFSIPPCEEFDRDQNVQMRLV